MIPSPRSFTMNRRLLPISLIAVAAFAGAGAQATPRKVQLLDFSAVAPGPVPRPIEEASAESDAVSRALASVFQPLPSPAEPMVNAGVSALGNPFVTYSIARNPVLVAPALDPVECAVPVYRPNGRLSPAAEARRRLIFPLVHRAACEHGLPVGLFDALIVQESRYQPLAISPKGAIGLAQLMPGTARDVGANPWDLYDNLRGGARYLRQQVDVFGRWDLALAAYNAGPGRVRRGWRVPAISETQSYVRTIYASWSGSTVPAGSVSGQALPYRQAKLIIMPASQSE